MMYQKLEKHYTRDFGLIITEWFRRISQDRFLQTLGVGYRDYLAVCDGETMTYYALEEDEQLFLKKTLEILKKNPQRIFELLRQCVYEGNRSRTIIQRMKKRLAKLSADDVQELLERHRLLYPGLRLAIRIPARWEKDILKVKEGRSLIQLAFRVRKQTDGIFEDIDLLTQQHAVSLLRQHGLPVRYAKFLRLSEYIQLVNGILPNVREMKSRAKGFVYVGGAVVRTSSVERELRRSRYILPVEKISGSSVRGQIAFPGSVVLGKVRIVNTLEQMRKFRPGEILVSTMTVPPFVPAMKLARAIVTDEGGVTCHAAIVAREFRKPCIIGTKVATRMFKNGDRVEVDATQGIVRKL